MVSQNVCYSYIYHENNMKLIPFYSITMSTLYNLSNTYINTCSYYSFILLMGDSFLKCITKHTRHIVYFLIGELVVH